MLILDTTTTVLIVWVVARDILGSLTFLRGPLQNKNVLQYQAKRSRIWGEFPQFRLLGLGLILRHRIILLIQFLGLPDCNFMYH